MLIYLSLNRKTNVDGNGVCIFQSAPVFQSHASFKKSLVSPKVRIEIELHLAIFNISHINGSSPLLALRHFKHINPAGLPSVAFTSCRLKHGLCTSFLLGFHSLPSPEIQMIRDHHRPSGGSGHAVEDRGCHFGGAVQPFKGGITAGLMTSLHKNIQE